MIGSSSEALLDFEEMVCASYAMLCLSAWVGRKGGGVILKFELDLRYQKAWRWGHG